MNGLEEHADNAQARDLYWKSLSWLGTIWPTSASDAFDAALWTMFVSTTLGLEVPVLSSLPRRHDSPLAEYGCKKPALDLYGDHTSTCTAHSGATKAHDSMVRCWAAVPHGRTHGPHAAVRNGKRRPTVR